MMHIKRYAADSLFFEEKNEAGAFEFGNLSFLGQQMCSEM